MRYIELTEEAEMDISKSTYELQKNIAIGSGLLLLVVVILLVVRNYPVGAQQHVMSTKNASSATLVSRQKNETTASAVKSDTSAKKYQYTANFGDSYSRFARLAVSTYASEHAIILNEAEISLLETALVREAGEPYLNIGQKVEISEESLKATFATLSL